MILDFLIVGFFDNCVSGLSTDQMFGVCVKDGSGILLQHAMRKRYSGQPDPFGGRRGTPKRITGRSSRPIQNGR
jgi:hypothetical protein